MFCVCVSVLCVCVSFNLCFFWHAFGHAYSSCGADESAEVAPHTFLPDDTRSAFLLVAIVAGLTLEGDGLVSAVHARDIATTAPYTSLAVDLREDHGVAVEMRGENDVL